MDRSAHFLFFAVLISASVISSQKLRMIELWSDENLVPVPTANSMPACDSQIYCQGKVLHTVSMAAIFTDSKTFVDMKMKYNEVTTLQSFNVFMNSTNQMPTRPELRTWVSENFEEPGSELETWIPTDYNENMTTLYAKIKDNAFKAWARDLNTLWTELGRKVKQEVNENPSQYSIMYIPNPTIVAGGRFLEIYYWDSYWIIQGLLKCEMPTTAKGMIENFIYLLEANGGHIPNGGRVYYSRRSQPPLLAGMMKSYFDATRDSQFVIQNILYLTMEFNFFHNNHFVNVNGYTLYRYIDDSFGPRPESYREDFELSKDFNTNADREEFYSEMKAGAESGMDFTSRWFIGPGNDNNGTLKNTKARSIIPVDLNAIMYWNAMIISEFYGLNNRTTLQAKWLAKAQTILTAMDAILWSEENGCWLDYDIVNSKSRNFFSVSNLSPLWVKAYRAENEVKITAKVLEYISRNKLDDYPGGVPNTLEQTGEQWDFPNVWAPMQHMLIIGLDNLQNQTAKDLAYKWANKWVQSNYLAFERYGKMFEKYNALYPGEFAGGGEYEPQTGFGWTNGVILDLLNKYGDRLISPESSNSTTTTSSSAITTTTPTTTTTAANSTSSSTRTVSTTTTPKPNSGERYLAHTSIYVTLFLISICILG